MENELGYLVVLTFYKFNNKLSYNIRPFIKAGMYFTKNKLVLFSNIL